MHIAARRPFAVHGARLLSSSTAAFASEASTPPQPRGRGVPLDIDIGGETFKLELTPEPKPPAPDEGGDEERGPAAEPSPRRVTRYYEGRASLATRLLERKGARAALLTSAREETQAPAEEEDGEERPEELPDPEQLAVTKSHRMSPAASAKFEAGQFEDALEGGLMHDLPFPPSYQRGRSTAPREGQAPRGPRERTPLPLPPRPASARSDVTRPSAGRAPRAAASASELETPTSGQAPRAAYGTPTRGQAPRPASAIMPRGMIAARAVARGGARGRGRGRGRSAAGPARGRGPRPGQRRPEEAEEEEQPDLQAIPPPILYGPITPRALLSPATHVDDSLVLQPPAPISTLMREFAGGDYTRHRLLQPQPLKGLSDPRNQALLALGKNAGASVQKRVDPVLVLERLLPREAEKRVTPGVEGGTQLRIGGQVSGLEGQRAGQARLRA